MFIFAHLGLTLGAAVLGSGVIGACRKDRSRAADTSFPQTDAGTRTSALSLDEWISRLHRFIDIRWLLIGAMLPDIIDKPLGRLFFENGRVFSHTLLLLLVILIAGIFLYRVKKGSWLLALAIGDFAHLVLDQMWLTPTTLFWPAYGFQFSPFAQRNWLAYWFNSLLENPAVYVPELWGLACLIGFIVWLWRRETLFSFLLRGKI